MSDNSFSIAQSAARLQRRTFLKYAGAAGSTAALALAGCGDDSDPTPTTTTVELGVADNGVLNYAYALKSIELGLYLSMRAGTYFTSLATAPEIAILNDIVRHEQTHVTFLKAMIPGGVIIRDLLFDFSSLNFNTREGALSAAVQFEDLAVAACNGAARFLTNPLTLAALSRIVSVEARHAAILRDLLSYNSFAGSGAVDAFTPAASGLPGDGTGTGLELSKTPTAVLALVNPFLKEGSKLTAASLV